MNDVSFYLPALPKGWFYFDVRQRGEKDWVVMIRKGQTYGTLSAIGESPDEAVSHIIEDMENIEDINAPHHKWQFKHGYISSYERRRKCNSQKNGR